ncbi:BamA/TamA family outer membrane protein [Phormidium sp. CLA17]|uniref:ShlB/FhaC/HecB family hemolysin secretion/activation protein n=1 Tax=Leptolyngbya sp. Cla-17 TaxID=2803751 RepID=UPI001490BDDE|nr:ShlB/FhaC/HecB family hemolysin secretion/activation protein [Leptolyngbya sp. Cla-17]MBM0744526.1 BamA/TamA family outer membrane protein [Leptolyngbya sp. Cla-17]
MRTPDRANQPAFIPAMPSGNLPITDPAFVPFPPIISLSDRLKAVSLVGLLTALGVGTVWLGHKLLTPDPNELLLPIPEPGSAPQSAPLRDRVQVIMPQQTINSVASPPLPIHRQAQPRQPAKTETTRTSHDFGAVAQPSITAVNPTLESSMPPQKQLIQEQPQNQAISGQTAVSQSAGQRSLTSAPPQKSSRPFPVALIAALLEAPPSNRSTETVAIVPRAATNPATPQVIPAPLTPISPRPPQSPSVQNPPATVGTSPPPTTPSIQPVPVSPPPIAKLPDLQNQISVDQLKITGSTRFSPKELAAIVRTVISSGSSTTTPNSAGSDRTKISPAELVQASELISKLYIDRGYINSGAYVPAEVLSGATPEIRVVEGKLEKINVQVQRAKPLWLARPLSPNYVRRRFDRAIQTPLQIDQLADAVRLLEQDPMITSISTELAPGTTTGRSVLNVKVRQAPPLNLTFSIDNGRAPSVGRFRQQAGLSHANLLGLGDRFQVGYNRSEGSRSLDLGYSIPINASNGTLSFLYGSSQGEVIEEPFRDLGIKSRSQTYEIGFRQPIKQTSTELFALSLRGTHYRNEGVFLEAFNDGVAIPFPARGTDIDGRTRITALRFGQEWLKRSERDVFSLQSEFGVGINALNATRLDDPPDGRFFSWQGRGFWVHSFAPDTLFALKGQLQFANRPLVPVEQIGLGGIDTVRGYRTSVLLADNGWFTSAEFYLPILRIPQVKGVLQLVPFFDVGRGWNQGEEQPDPASLISTGLGLQWKMGNTFRARLDWGVPLINSTAVNGQSLRESLFFSVIFTP